MHPSIHEQVAQARIADLHQQARLNRLVHEAGPARRARAEHPPGGQRGHRSAVVGRLLAALRVGTAAVRS